MKGRINLESFSDWLVFFCIIPFTVFINFFLKFKFKNLAILFLSLIFLFWFCSVRVTLNSVFVSLVIYFFSFLIDCVNIKKIKFFLCCSSVVLVLFFLFFTFKFIFFVEGNAFFDFERIVVSLIGMANISYIVDVYKKRAYFQRSLIKFLTYVFMFPKLFLGPAVVYYKFSKQLSSRNVSFHNFSNGVELFIVGFAKKIILANEFYEIYSFVDLQTVSGLSILTAWLGAGAGFLSLIFNFSGYSDMAVGLGKMLGFDLQKNSKNVVFANSVVEFFQKFNYSVLNYLKIYIFPWWYLKFYGFKFLKIIIITFFYAFFFGLSGACCLTAGYFLLIVLIEKMLSKLTVVKILKYFQKFLTCCLLLIGTVLFQRKSIFENLSFFGSMFGLSGIFFDVSSVFFVVLAKFLIMVAVLIVIKSFNKLKFFKFKNLEKSTYFKSLGLIILFISSLILSLSQL